MASYTATDIYFSSDGDFIKSANKDLQDTSSNPIRSFIQELEARIKFRKNEWPGDGKNIGIDLSDFIGKPNTEELAQQIKLRVTGELTRNGFIAINDLVVDVVPIDVHLLLIIIKIKLNNNIISYNTRFSIREKSFGSKGKID